MILVDRHFGAVYNSITLVRDIATKRIEKIPLQGRRSYFCFLRHLARLIPPSHWKTALCWLGTDVVGKSMIMQSIIKTVSADQSSRSAEWLKAKYMGDKTLFAWVRTFCWLEVCAYWAGKQISRCCLFNFPLISNVVFAVFSESQWYPDIVALLSVLNSCLCETKWAIESEENERMTSVCFYKRQHVTLPLITSQIGKAALSSFIVMCTISYPVKCKKKITHISWCRPTETKTHSISE